MMRRREGFTLVEMLVVIGILGILATIMVVSMGSMKKTAMQGEAQKQVSEVATAFGLVLQKERGWPETLVKNANESGGMNQEVCRFFQRHRLLDVTTYRRDKESNALTDEINWNSLDRFGMLDPYGRAGLKKARTCRMEDADVPDCLGTFRGHRLQYRLDQNYDGFVDAGEGSPRGRKVRASVLVWSRGPDGKDDESKSHYPDDDRLSWVAGGAK